MDSYDLVVIGAGPGGYVAAIRAAQLGLNAACIEEEKALGGTCLRVGCIPSKALLESSERYWEARQELGRHGIKLGNVELDLAAMLKRKDTIVRTLTQGIESLFKKNKVTRYAGRGRILAPGRVAIEGDEAGEITAKHILIATGSKSAPLPGVEIDGNRIGTSTEALAYPEVPKHLIVIGAGYIGLELGSVWRRLGSEVTVLEYLDRILPGMDGELAAEALKTFKKQGLNFRLSCKVTSARVDEQGCVVDIEGQEAVRGDHVLVAVGRVPNTVGLGLDTVNVECGPKGRIMVDEQYATSVPGIYAIGDVIGGAMLAHKAEDEGMACVEQLVAGYGHVNYDAIPGVVYTQPEIASVGKTEEELKEAAIEYRKGVFPFVANGRAKALGQIDGRIKILANAETDRVLGVHIIGPRAGDLIAEAALAMEFGASSEDIARTCHAHPTLAEAFREAALNVDGRAIHI
ncbi:MAG: dihydrolipoyl dehydrogenase [Candidatus Hydrogenedentes bacterium]|nr:dihydrolipoyl dehydrogenase [Candidatus Hydrogenedentota bacterium]